MCSIFPLFGCIGGCCALSQMWQEEAKYVGCLTCSSSKLQCAEVQQCAVVEVCTFKLLIVQVQARVFRSARVGEILQQQPAEQGLLQQVAAAQSQGRGKTIFCKKNSFSFFLFTIYINIFKSQQPTLKVAAKQYFANFFIFLFFLKICINLFQVAAVKSQDHS